MGLFISLLPISGEGQGEGSGFSLFLDGRGTEGAGDVAALLPPGAASGALSRCNVETLEECHPACGSQGSDESLVFVLGIGVLSARQSESRWHLAVVAGLNRSLDVCTVRSLGYARDDREGRPHLSPLPKSGEGRGPLPRQAPDSQAPTLPAPPRTAACGLRQGAGNWTWRSGAPARCLLTCRQPSAE